MRDSRLSRRQVLAGTGTLWGVAGLDLLSHGRAAAGAGSRGVPVSAELEPLVRMIEETPRDKLVEAAAARIRAGAGYRELLAATFLAGVRSIHARPVGFEFHCVLAVHAAHLSAQAGPADQRFTPLFWAMDAFKDSQQVKRGKGEGDWVLPVLDPAKLPPPEQARRRYIEAMAAWDEEGADLAIAALVRSTPPEKIRDLLFRHGARDFRDIGHKAIYTANAWRTLTSIGWQHAEPVLRSLTFGCLDHEGTNPAQRDDPADRPWRENLDRLGKVRAGWTEGQIDPGAVTALLHGLRRASAGESCAMVVGLLNGKIAPTSLWDGLHLYASELVMRKGDIIALHAVTSINALHQAFSLSTDAETRLLMLLQAAAYLPLFREELADNDRGGPRVDGLKTGPTNSIKADGDGTVAQIFADVGPRTPRAAQTALAWLDQDRHQGAALLDQGRRLLFAKGRTAHHYKFAAAAFEDFAQVSPAHRNRYLAANLGLLRGSHEPDNPLITRAHMALRG